MVEGNKINLRYFELSTHLWFHLEVILDTHDETFSKDSVKADRFMEVTLEHLLKTKHKKTS